MTIVLCAKFTQHADLRERLLATFPYPLIESSRTDAFWGAGADGPRALDHRSHDQLVTKM